MAALLVASACASSNKPAPQAGHAQLEIYCPRPPGDRAGPGACHAWGALYPIGCKFDEGDWRCGCHEVRTPGPEYSPAGERYLKPPELPPTEVHPFYLRSGFLLAPDMLRRARSS